MDSKRIAGAKSQTLTIRSVEAGDVGAYTCRVSNSDGSLLSAPTNLSLMAAEIPGLALPVCIDVGILCLRSAPTCDGWSQQVQR